MKQKIVKIVAMAFAVMLTCAPLAANAQVLSGYTSKVDYSNTDPDRYTIDIDLNNQILTVYENDESGNPVSIVFQGLCSTGREEYPTGAGTFALGDLKERFGYFVAHGQYAQYWTQIVRGIYIHSIMYNDHDLTELSKSAYNDLGEAVSHACVRVLPHYAQWIFYNCPPGTKTVISANRADNSALVDSIRDEMPSYDSLYGISDFNPDPVVIAATTKSNNVPVRTGSSSVNDTTIDELNYGDKVLILQLSEDWCKIEMEDGTLGYVKSDYLHFNPDDPAYQISYTYKAVEDTALYLSASTSASELVQIPAGESVTVIGTRDKFWYTAFVDGNVGYVRSRYVKVDEQTRTYPDVPGISEDGQFTDGGAAMIEHGINANFRTGPSTSYDVIGTYPGGTPVTLLSQHGTWYKAIIGGVEGYISSICIAF